MLGGGDWACGGAWGRLLLVRDATTRLVAGRQDHFIHEPIW